MSDELNPAVEQPLEAAEPELQHEVAQDTAEAVETVEEKIFKQDDVNHIVSKKVAEERTKSEKRMTELQQRLERFEQLFSNFGKQPEAQPQAPVLDPNRPLTISEYQTMMQQQALQKQAELANQKLNEFENDVKTKFSDFDTIKEQHADVFQVLDSDEVIANAAVATGQPLEFMYHVAKVCPNEIKKIASITNPMLKFAEMIRLEAKLKQSAKVPNQSGAPTPLDDIRGDGMAANSDDIQSLRKQLAGH